MLIEHAVGKSLPAVVVPGADRGDYCHLGKTLFTRKLGRMVDETAPEPGMLSFPLVALADRHSRTVDVDFADQRAGFELGDIGRLFGKTQAQEAGETI